MKPVLFWDTQTLLETPDIRKRCDAKYVETQLKEKHPEEELRMVSVNINETGSYQNPLTCAFLEMFASGLKMERASSLCGSETGAQAPRRSYGAHHHLVASGMERPLPGHQRRCGQHRRASLCEPGG
jgi:hypothetical protein